MEDYLLRIRNLPLPPRPTQPENAPYSPIPTPINLGFARPPPAANLRRDFETSDPASMKIPVLVLALIGLLSLGCGLMLLYLGVAHRNLYFLKWVSVPDLALGLFLLIFLFRNPNIK